MKITIAITWLTLWIGTVCSTQSVLKMDILEHADYKQALDLLAPYKIEDKDFEPLSYDEIVIGSDIKKHRPKPMSHIDIPQPDYNILVGSLSEEQKAAIEILERNSNKNDPISTQILAELYMFGNYSIPTNGSLALQYYERLTKLSLGDANAHYMLGFIYATGLFGEVEQDQARALIHYQTSHELGNLRSTMVLAYRYYKGISVESSCSLALYYYNTIAQKSIDYVHQGPIGGPNIDSYSVRLSDFVGGLYGNDVSEQSSSVSRPAMAHIYDRNIFSELNIDPGKHRSVQMYYEAIAYYRADYFHKRDYERAFVIAHECAVEGDDIIKWSTDSIIDQIFVSKCCSLLGHMYLRGEGTNQNYTESLKWHMKASELNAKPALQYDLGLIYEFGLGLEEPNIAKAKLYYELSKETSDKSKFYLARLILNEEYARDMADKDRYEQGSPFWKGEKFVEGLKLLQRAAYGECEEASYYLGLAYERESAGFNPCKSIVASYKSFVEQIEPVVSVLDWSFKQYFLSKDIRSALIGYAMAAEQGYEVAQSNAGYLLYPPLPLSHSLPKMSKERYEAALTYYSRSADQANIDSSVFTGDLYYYGALSSETGNVSPATAPDYEKAFYYYQQASNRHSRQGSFNLGYMYEQGLGVPKDYHLAKRYYDFALLGKTSDTYLAVSIALFRLKLKLFWEHLIGGNGVEEENQSQKRTWNDWKNLYKSIRETNRQYLMDEIEEDAPLQRFINDGDDEETYHEIIESGLIDDLMLLLVIAIIGILIFYHSRNRRREAGDRDQDNNRGDGGEPLNFQFNFMIIPL